MFNCKTLDRRFPLYRYSYSSALRLLAGFLLLMQFGCDFGHYKQKLNDDYTLSAIDTNSNMALFYSYNKKLVGVVHKQVIAYVVEDSFIAVIRQHSSNGNGKEEDYYFVPLTEPFITDHFETNVAGPLSLDEVTSLAVERGAPAPLAFKSLPR